MHCICLLIKMLHHFFFGLSSCIFDYIISLVCEHPDKFYNQICAFGKNNNVNKIASLQNVAFGHKKY